MEEEIELLIGTYNRGKFDEIKELLTSSFKILSLNDIDKKFKIKETGKTFLDNALIKATKISKDTLMATLADDSGLVVPALKGEPGIFSSRYAGEKATDEENIEKLLSKIKKLEPEDRKAYFESAVVVAKPSGENIYSTGRVNGIIITPPMGNKGFGYDPIFYIPSLKCTMAELDIAKKIEISHRGEALRKIFPHLLKFMNLN